jgi:hypothetical protein
MIRGDAINRVSLQPNIMLCAKWDKIFIHHPSKKDSECTENGCRDAIYRVSQYIGSDATCRVSIIVIE